MTAIPTLEKSPMTIYQRVSAVLFPVSGVYLVLTYGDWTGIEAVLLSLVIIFTWLALTNIRRNNQEAER